MGINFKEKLQNINKTKVIILTVVLFVMAIIAVLGYEYIQMKNVANMETAAPPTESVLVKGPEEVLNEQKPMRPSDYKIGIEYNKAVKADKPIVVLFYADWCRYCIGFMPTYQSLSNIYKDTYNFSKVNVEDPKYEKLVKEIGITGFPTVYLIDPKYDNKVLLSNSIFGELKKLRIELDRFARIRNMLDKN